MYRKAVDVLTEAQRLDLDDKAIGMLCSSKHGSKWKTDEKRARASSNAPAP